MKLKVTIDGKTYEVEVEASEPEPRRPSYVSPTSAAPHTSVAAPSAAPAAPPAGNSPMDEGKVCRSPIAGIVVKVSAQIGQAIQANDVLIVLEAMKMETNIASPIAGKIKTVHVSPGQAVKAGQLLVEFE